MNDYLPDELPAEDEPVELEPWWWCELMTTAPLDEGEAEVEEKGEERETYLF